MNDENKNTENNENNKASFLDFLQLMGEMNKQRENELEHVTYMLAHHLRTLYKSLIREGFSSEQAMDLVKCVISGASANNVLK